MKKVLLGLLGVVALAAVGVLGAASMKPDVLHIERSITVTAAAGDVSP